MTFATWGFMFAGAALMSVPIIIHLLNKRRFKIVDWAAMDFLFDADRRNRRRVRLENLIILLLRCLAMFLLGCLLARPALPRSVTRGWIETQQFERIVLVDDSLSMQMRGDGESAMEDVKKSLEELVVDLMGDESDDRLTLIVASNPQERLLNAIRIQDQNLAEIQATIKNLQTSDKSANLDVALQQLERELKSNEEEINRVVYVMTDLRHRDWRIDRQAESSNNPVKVIKRLAEEASACLLVDVGQDLTRNIAITDIIAEQQIVAGAPARFEVVVTNFGTEPVTDAGLRFYVNDQEINDDPAKEPMPVPRLAGYGKEGSTASINFRHVFHIDEGGAAGPIAPGERQEQEFKSFKVHVELVAGGLAGTDSFEADNTRYFAARVARGTPVLIVDGQPLGVARASESAFLDTALAPPGPVSSGVLVDNQPADIVFGVTSELDKEMFDQYRVIFLCNTYQLTDDIVAILEEWVSKGGGLVILPGDQVEERDFNKYLYKDGKGLSPVQLIKQELMDEGQWVHFQVPRGSTHQIFSRFDAEDWNLNDVKIHQWWRMEANKERKDIQIPATFSVEVESHPAVVEQSFGDGHVYVHAIPADLDWTNWPDLPTYLPYFVLLVNHVALNATDDASELVVGETLQHSVPLSQYQVDATIQTPDDTKKPVQAAPMGEDPKAATPADVEEAAEEDEVWRIDFANVEKRGIYDLNLMGADGEHQVKFAANIESNEGELKRVNLAQLGTELEETGVAVVKGAEVTDQNITGADDPVWIYVLALVALVLCTEQFLGWFWGRRR